MKKKSMLSLSVLITCGLISNVFAQKKIKAKIVDQQDDVHGVGTALGEDAQGFTLLMRAA